jgi:protein subunit release factor A
VDLAIRARRASTRGTQGNLNRISKQNYKTRRLTPVSVEMESQDITVVLRRLDHVIDKKAGRDAAEFFS